MVRDRLRDGCQPGRGEGAGDGRDREGLSTALHEEITIDAGRCTQSSFSDYRVPSLAEMPEINVYVVESGHPIGGVAEAGVPSTAPALCNVILQATGNRIRSLPVRLDA